MFIATMIFQKNSSLFFALAYFLINTGQKHKNFVSMVRKSGVADRTETQADSRVLEKSGHIGGPG